jgi:transcriptional regulator with XRE-family HTH domain
MPFSVEEFGRLIAAKRGSQGIRTAAGQIGISSATLSRIENGNIPDLATFEKICRWLERDPGEFLGFESRQTPKELAVVHFRKSKTVSAETAGALGELILAIQKAAQARRRLIGS